MRKYIQLCLLLLFLGGGNLISQGILGKKAIVKAGVINGFRLPLNDLQFEYAIGKKVSLTAGFSLLSSKIRPEYRLAYAYEFLNTSGVSALEDYNYNPAEIAYASTKLLDSRAYLFDDNDVYTSPQRLTVQSSVWSIGFRKYKDPIFSAPYGKYFSMEFFRGTQKVSGTVQVPVPIVDEFSPFGYSSYFIQDTRNVKVKDRKINTTSFQMNFGKQWVKFDVLTIDFSWGFAYSITKADNRAQDGYIASILARNNGANFGSFPSPTWNTIASEVNYRRNAFGLNLFLKLGYLIF